MSGEGWGNIPDWISAFAATVSAAAIVVLARMERTATNKLRREKAEEEMRWADAFTNLLLHTLAMSTEATATLRIMLADPAPQEELRAELDDWVRLIGATRRRIVELRSEAPAVPGLKIMLSDLEAGLVLPDQPHALRREILIRVVEEVYAHLAQGRDVVARLPRRSPPNLSPGSPS